MSAAATTDTARQPRPTPVYGSDYLATAIVAAWLRQARGIESRLVRGTWEHRSYATEVSR